MRKKHKIGTSDGSRPRRSRLEKLRKAWGKATSEERAAFLEHISAIGDVRPPEEMPLIANGRYLLPSTIARIETLMVRRGIRPAEVMAEMGFADGGPVLLRALAKRTSLRLAIIAALQKWLELQDADSGDPDASR